MQRKPPDPGTNAEAVRLALTTLKLEDEHAAIAQAAKSLAAAVDRVPDDAQLWREYRQVLELLVRVGAGGSDDDTAAWVYAIQTPRVPAKVRNAKKS